MKQLILCASMMLTFTTLAQWDVGYYVDDNEIETGDIFLYQEVVGTFSKSSKKDKVCGYFIEHDPSDKIFSITIYPFNKQKEEVWKYDTFQWGIIKSPSGKLVPIEAFCFDGMIYFDGIEYDQFMNATKQYGTYALIMNHTIDKTNYEFTFNK